MKIIFLFIVLLMHASAWSQNLLANGGFEDENSCTEYHVNCAPEAWISTSPSFIFYFKNRNLAHSGEHTMGLLAGHSKSIYKRTFIRSRLVCSLQKDHQYQLSFFVRSRHNILDSAGIYFTSYDFLFEKNLFRKIIPTVFLADARIKPVAADTNWQPVTIQYTATGEENFISIGYFAKSDLTGMSTGISMENNFLIFIDDLSMVPLDPKEQLCAGWKTNTDSIYAQDEWHEFLDWEIKYYRQYPPPVSRYATTILPQVDTLLIPDILFASGSAELNKQSHPLLDSLCTAVSKKHIDSLIVEGHTDSVGKRVNNEKLSAGRAEAVKEYIQQQTGLTDNKLMVRFFADARPIASNATVDGRQKNRRVELLLYRHN